ncbi:MAG: Tim44 domain-containing protein [Candidatus Magnetominusculus sp. LBB02]|nr:Tim44 domain-containing protein [Candidatus Magnetominusculus sp. LBB02]
MKRAALMIIALIIITSCSKKEVKVQPMESEKARAVVEMLQKLKDAYVKKDVDGLRSMMTPEGFKAITPTMRKFDSSDLKLAARWVDIKDDGSIVVSTSWDGTWKYAGQSITEKGTAMFLFTGAPLRLDSILRDSPFIYP